MQNTYICSTVSLRSRGSHPFSINDYTLLLNDVYEKTPSPCPPLSSSSSCCICCEFPIHRVPLSPSFLYGLRQSTLIQFSASRRLILAGRNRCSSPLSVYDTDPCCCRDLTCTVRERGVVGSSGRRIDGRLRREVIEKRRRRRRCSAVVGDEAEAVLSFLTEEVDEKYYGVRESSHSFSSPVQVKGRRDYVKEGFRKGNDGDLSENNYTIESLKYKPVEAENRRREEKEVSVRNPRERTRSSSCSSYYSFSSSGDFGSDFEDQQKPEGAVSGVSLPAAAQKSGRFEEDRFDEEVQKENRGCRKDFDRHEVVREQGNHTVRLDASGNSTQSDWRKKSEKKLAEVAWDETNSKEEFLDKFSGALKARQNASAKVSSCTKNNAEDESRFSKRGGKHHSQIGVESRQFLQHADSGTTSKSHQKVDSTEEENLVLTTDTSEKAEYDFARKGEYRRNSEQLTDVRKIHGTVSNSRSQSGTSQRYLGRNAIFSGSKNEVQYEHHISGQNVKRKTDSRKDFQQTAEIIANQDCSIETNSSLKRRPDSLVNNKDGNLNLISNSRPNSECLHFESTNISTSRNEFVEGTRDVTSTSHYEESAKRMSGQERHLIPVKEMVGETRERYNHTSGNVLQDEPRIEGHKSWKIPCFREASLKEGFGTQDSLVLVDQAGVGKIGVDGKGKKSTSSEAIVIPPPSQSITRASMPVELTGNFTVEENINKVSGQTSVYIYPQEQQLSLQPRPQCGSSMVGTFEGSSHPIPHEDVLGSADRLDKSSVQFVEEYFKKVKSEVSASEILEESFGKSQLTPEGEEDREKNLRRNASESEHVGPTISNSEVEGPSVDMWDEMDPEANMDPTVKMDPAVIMDTAAEESSKPEASEVSPDNKHNIIKRPNNRSLWNIVSDIVLLRWVSHTDSPRPAVKLSGKSSSNESASSEAWFSGNEPDESSDKNRINSRRSNNASPKPMQMLAKERAGQRKRLGSDAKSSENSIVHAEVDDLPSSTILDSHATSDTISLPSVYASNNLNQVSSLGTSFSRSAAESSVPLATGGGTSLTGKSLDTSSNDVSERYIIEQTANSVSPKPIGLSGMEGNDGELKRRKLQRKKQVMKDRFDEWEEAYKSERDQRKIDEMFMREALLEAKKAADAWEVPVGAVLVQHGKVIARGCNLVEALRDSTAHAEVICIREASNLLRSWRLVDTTLYVTLEPCPMCAGAILQARIDTLVWGAPNKLLGADGSWIRLFPGGRGSVSESTDKPEPPVHPFHPKMTIRRAVLATECADTMQQFFQLRRRKKGKNEQPHTPPPSLPVTHNPSKFMTKIHNIFHILCL